MEEFSRAAGRRPRLRSDRAQPALRLGSIATGQTIVADAGYHGTLEIDLETGEVLHLEYLAGGLPESLPLAYASTKADYAPMAIAGRDYLLPSHSETEMGTSTNWTRNIVEFREYCKFSADSTIDFSPSK